jgi:hypothetical protein
MEETAEQVASTHGAPVILGAGQVVEAAGELRVMVAKQEADLPSSLVQHQQQVPGLLGDPAAILTETRMRPVTC